MIKNIKEIEEDNARYIQMAYRRFQNRKEHSLEIRNSYVTCEYEKPNLLEYQ